MRFHPGFTSQIIKRESNNFGDQIIEFKFQVLDEHNEIITEHEEFYTFSEGSHVEPVSFMEIQYKQWKKKFIE